MNGTSLPRTSGILLHPTSLPSPYGIGDLGRSAYEFVDFLAQAGQHLWQVLPLTHTGFGDSPYQSFSAFAGQPLLISPAYLQELQLVSQDDLNSCPQGDPTQVDYGAVIPWKNGLLRKAFQSFQEGRASHLNWDFDHCLDRFSIHFVFLFLPLLNPSLSFLNRKFLICRFRRCVFISVKKSEIPVG